MQLLTCSVFVVFALVSITLSQPWVGDPWVPAPNLQQDWMEWIWMDRFNEHVNNSRDNANNIHVVFYGDSIMEAWPADIWNRAYAPLGAVNYGIAGDATQHVLWRIINGEVDHINPRVVVLKIGTNNLNRATSPGIAQGITAIVNALRERLPTTRVLLLGILPRSNDTMITLGDEVNQIVSSLENLNTVRFLNMRNAFYGGNGQFFWQYFVDLLNPIHLTHLGYLRWEELMYPLFNAMLNAPPL